MKWLVQDVVLLWVLQKFNENTMRSELEFYLIDTIKNKIEIKFLHYRYNTIIISYADEAFSTSCFGCLTIKKKREKISALSYIILVEFGRIGNSLLLKFLVRYVIIEIVKIHKKIRPNSWRYSSTDKIPNSYIIRSEEFSRSKLHSILVD